MNPRVARDAHYHYYYSHCTVRVCEDPLKVPYTHYQLYCFKIRKFTVRELRRAVQGAVSPFSTLLRQVQRVCVEKSRARRKTLISSTTTEGSECIYHEDPEKAQNTHHPY